MSTKYIERNCKTHGKTIYRLSGKRWRCVKCCSKTVQKRRNKLKQLAIEYTGGKCIICGYNKCIAAL